MLFVKIFGSFRWLAFIIGAALIAAVSWVLWPDFAQNVQKEGVNTSETVRIVHDSTGIQAVRDSLRILRGKTLAVRIVRVTIRDTVHGTEEIYLDSGAVVHDSIFLTRTIHDTLAVHVHDTLYSRMKTGPVRRDDWAVTAGVDVSHGISLSGTPAISISAGVERRIVGPLYVSAGVDEKTSAIKSGWIKGLNGKMGVLLRFEF